MSLGEAPTFEEVLEEIKEKGIDITGFDTEELMVVAFMVGAAGAVGAMTEVCEEIDKVLKEKYNSEEVI